MTVTFQLKDGTKVAVSNYQLTITGDRAELWRVFLERRFSRFGPSPSDLDPDRTFAELVISKIGGKILKANDPPKRDAEMIY